MGSRAPAGRLDHTRVHNMPARGSQTEVGSRAVGRVQDGPSLAWHEGCLDAAYVLRRMEP